MAALTLFRPVGILELRLIAEANWEAFPPRLPEQPIFYPVLNEPYAIQISRDWNAKDEGSFGFVTRFDVDLEFVGRYDRQFVGGKQYEELWVPAEELEEFNSQIQGEIVVTRYYRNFGDGPIEKEIDEQLTLEQIDDWINLEGKVG